MKFSIKDFFSKCDQTRSFLRIWSHLLKKSLVENFIFCAVVLEAAKTSYANKTRESLPRYLAFGTFGELLIVFSTKVNLLYLFYSTAGRCCLLHLIKQNCLLKSFLGTLILMNQVSHYLLSLLELI